MEVLSFINNKGGVGKTTLCWHVAQALALTGQRVLCIDNDFQHNLTNRFGLTIGDTTVRNIYCGDYEDYNSFLQKSVRETSIPNLHLITSEFNLSYSDVKDTNALADFLHNSIVSEYYDFVCIDNHPGLESLQVAAVRASSRLIIPVLLRQQSMEGLAEMMHFLLANYEVPKETITIVPNHAENIKIQQRMFSVLEEMLGEFIAETAIPMDRTIEEVEQEQKSIFLDRFASSKSGIYFAKLVTDLFPHIAKDYNDAWSKIKEERNQHRADIARTNLLGK